MGHTYSKLLYHVVFSTKERRPYIGKEIRDRLHAYMGGIIKECGALPLAIGGTGDHVHLLIETRPSMGLSDLIRIVKANSSKWIHETSTTHCAFAWQSGYAVFTVSASMKERVDSYVRDQGAHHAAKSFDEEYKGLLEKHGMTLDPRDEHE